MIYNIKKNINSLTLYLSTNKTKVVFNFTKRPQVVMGFFFHSTCSTFHKNTHRLQRCAEISEREKKSPFAHFEHAFSQIHTKKFKSTILFQIMPGCLL